MAYFEQTRLTDSDGIVINPAEQQTLYTINPPNDSPGPVVRTAAGSVDNQITLLRRIVKLLESTAATDVAQRQRITLDAITAGVTLPAVTTVTTVTTVGSVTNLAAVNGWNQQMFADPARTAYNTGIRAQLTFS
jgi:hypothetical protein